MGVRKRGWVAVCVVLVALFVLAHPAPAQVTLPPSTTTTSTTPGVTSTTSSTSTTTSTTVVNRSTTTTEPAVTPRSSPRTTVRRPTTTTTSAPGRTTTTTRPARPTTTAMQEFPDATSQSTTTSSLPLEQAASAEGLSIGSIVALIVAGLLGVAAILSLLTVRYWRATRPPGGPSA